ncbi:hypothetical protein [Kibdelosporangium persicum]|nr:hypothetical protein [Kibdelosporangium persicum]
MLDFAAGEEVYSDRGTAVWGFAVPRRLATRHGDRPVFACEAVA